MKAFANTNTIELVALVSAATCMTVCYVTGLLVAGAFLNSIVVYYAAYLLKK